MLRFQIEYIYRDAPKYWAQADFDCSDLWKGILPPPEFIPLFNTLLPSIDVKVDLDKLQCPVYLAAGTLDYDCCPWVWESLTQKYAKLYVEKYEHSGHYPHYEEQALFDKQILRWLKKQA